MKIAITSLYLPSGSKIGVGYQVHHFANALVKRGHSVTVFSQTGASADSLYEAVVVDSGRRLRTFGFAWNLRNVDLSGYDVVHAHGDDWFLWGRKPRRLVHTFHGSCLAECIHAKGLVNKARMALLAACEFSAALLADELVAVSGSTTRYMPMAKRVIPNGVDLTEFRPAAERSSHPTLLFVGTLHGRKRGRLLMDAWRREVLPRVPGAELWAVTEERDDTVPGVKWLGRVSHADLTDLYGRAWAFCLPSSYEGFGVPYIEAMASGAAVVATPNDGSREVLRDGLDGLLVDDAGLGDAVARVLTDEPLRRKLAEAGLRRSRDFGFDAVCSAYETLYSPPATVGQPAARTP